MVIEMGSRRSRREVGRSLRAPDGDPLEPGGLPAELARRAGASEPSAVRPTRRRLVLTAVLVPLVVVLVSMGVAYGTGVVTPPWRPARPAPVTPSPAPDSRTADPSGTPSQPDDSGSSGSTRSATPTSSPTSTSSRSATPSGSPSTSPTGSPTTKTSRLPSRSPSAPRTSASPAG